MSDLATSDTVMSELEQYRPELLGYCYRILGSTYDADDAVQDTFVKAWQGIGDFEGRSALRSWLYRIATNVCLDMLRGRRRRALPMDLSLPVPSSTPPVDVLPESYWLQPVPDGAISGGDPAERAVLRESVRLAFVAALQHLPPKQRVVLILRDVLCWQAAEVAALLDTTVVSVNSALQRARATLATRGDTPEGAPGDAPADADAALLARYVAAFESYDIDSLVALMHEDASISMPPFTLWLRGRDELKGWYLGYGAACRGARLVPVAANGMPAFAEYKRNEQARRHEPWCIQVLEVREGRVTHVHHFLDTSLFERFGLPAYFDF